MNAPVAPSARPQAKPRDHYRVFRSIGTRWMDNDIYGHVNNVNYYSYFDTAVNRYLIDAGVLDIHGGEVVGFVVETQCQYFAPIAFPDTVHAGIRVTQLGNRSVRYEVGLFRNDDDTPAAAGHFVHVYVDRASGRPVAIPDNTRAALEKLLVP